MLLLFHSFPGHCRFSADFLVFVQFLKALLDTESLLLLADTESLLVLADTESLLLLADTESLSLCLW